MEQLSNRDMDFLGWFENHKEQYRLEEIKNKESLKAWRKEMKEIRLEWLNHSIESLEKEIKDAYLNDAELRKQHKPYWFRMIILQSLRNTEHNETMLGKYVHQRLMISNPITDVPKQIDVQMIKDNLDINLVVTLNAGGFGTCPFHKDKSPSMKWYPQTKTLHCFSCGWHGDVISFIMKRDGLTFKEVINKLS